MGLMDKDGSSFERPLLARQGDWQAGLVMSLDSRQAALEGKMSSMCTQLGNGSHIAVARPGKFIRLSAPVLSTNCGEDV